MSNNYLRLIPTDPTNVPSQDRIEQALSVLQQLHPNAPLKVVTWDEIEFVDQGANFETVSCPYCGCRLDVTWWGEQMSHAYEASHFRERSVETPCCACITDLNDLRYSWTAGFARFMLELPNPECDLGDEDLSLVSNALATPLRRIWAHY